MLPYLILERFHFFLERNFLVDQLFVEVLDAVVVCSCIVDLNLKLQLILLRLVLELGDLLADRFVFDLFFVELQLKLLL